MATNFVMRQMNRVDLPKSLTELIFISSTSDNSIHLNNETRSITSAEEVELINLTHDHEKPLLKIPFIFDRVILRFSSLRLESLKCILTSSKDSSTFLISAYEIKLPLNNNYTGTIKIEIVDGNERILKFKFYREPFSIFQPSGTNSRTILANERKLSNPSHPIDTTIALSENPFPIPMIDGPLFRETVNYYEQLAPIILKKLQSPMDKMNNLDQNLRSLESSKLQMLETLKDFRKGFLPSGSKNNLVYAKFDSFETKSMESDLTYQFLQSLRQSNGEIKSDPTVLKSLQNFGSVKKNFEEESKKFYDWLSKLMSSGKAKDEKLLNKMKNFEISQIEYFNYLYDSITPMLLVLVDSTSKFSKEYKKNRLQREDAIRKIKDCNSMDEYTKLMQNYSKITIAGSTLLLIDPSSSYKLYSNKLPLKAGLLFVHGGQGKSGWHKQWLVLLNGKLYEYMDWRRGAELRNSPLDISLCNVKLLDFNDHKNNVDIGLRKNCFRVINAQGIEHVFQAFTSEDANEWVKVLIDAGQMVTLNKPLKQRSRVENNSTRSEHNENLEVIHDKVSGENTLKLNRPRIRRVSSVSLSLLNVVRTIDPSNCVCADCGSTDQVEWISLNLLVVFCIKCSSAHRGLGTSVSKVRSLTLDSFAGEHRVLVCHINNASVNSVYESKLLPSSKPNPESNHEARLEFITNKYMKKQFISDKTRINASNTLLEGVKHDNIQKVLEGIAGGGNVNKKFYYTPNSTESSSASIISKQSASNNRSEITFLEYSLLHPSVLDGREVFDIAELLTLNGCDIGTQVRPGSLLDENAKRWWQIRIDKINGTNTQTPKTSSNQMKQNSPNNDGRTSISSGRPLLPLTTNHRKLSPSSKPKIKGPREGFSIFKKKIKNLE